MANKDDDIQQGNPAPAALEAAHGDSRPVPADALIILPVRNTVLFPRMIQPIGIGRPISVAAAQEAARSERSIGILQQRNPEIDVPAEADLYRVGTMATIVRYITAPDGSHHIIAQGQQRFGILEFLEGYPFLVARVAPMEEVETTSSEIEARTHRLKQQAAAALEFMPQAPPELAAAIESTNVPGALADLIAGFLELKPAEKQEVLETLDVQARLDKVLGFLEHRLEVLRLAAEIGKQTKESVDARQREFMLREQLKTIQKELGETDAKAVEVEELAKAIAEAHMPPEVEEQARRELTRLERMPEGAGEHSMIRAYLDWLIALPWSANSPESIDIAEARRILDEDHYGLEKIKRRILEYLAVRKLNPQGRSPILCFVGPPGVGKTSLGQSIARALGLKFVRVSLGGVHDEAEIRGHRRTYLGALPGNIIQGIRKAGTRNPVFMLDEMDKLGAGFQGDPSAALLEVLDPEQNATFRDNYLAVPFDLSKVVFIGTANVLDTIPGPLRDRMEVIELSGYTEEEKAQIARRYLVRRQLLANGLKPEQCEITDAAVLALVRDYTREAGVRSLEREIGRVFRHVAMRIAEGAATIVQIDVGDLQEMLGAPRYESEVAMRTSLPGVATGLAWTPVGGDILFVEASRAPGSGRLILTGQLGDVMKESAQAALSLVKARASELGLTAAIFEKNDVHIHVPAGAIPKDGPSAGVAMFIALVSLFTAKTVHSDIAMTGEISLRGLVLPVGGIKEKVVAASRAGISTVVLPSRNRKDLEDIPDSVRRKMKFVWVDHVSDAVAAAIGTEVWNQAPAALEASSRSAP
ncbi:MAG: endopeptidase La [Gammaproteobacteria bacterium]|nr:endopeptidase La [Gammaproteobacteria bacterium]